MNPGFCSCGPGATPLPYQPLGLHKPFCLAWDWAVADNLISWDDLLIKLEQGRQELGISREEVAEAERKWRR